MTKNMECYDPEQVLLTDRKDIPNTLFTIMYSVKAFCVHFIVHQADCENKDGKLCFKPMADNWTEYDLNPNEETEILSGYVKWDGCTNWDAASVHCCEREHLVAFGEILGQCYDLGKLCPNWSEYCSQHK